MKIALTMPQFGESITEALIVRWLKKAGEVVSEREPLVEMETEKSVFSYESPFKGTLAKILQAENQQVAVGTEIAHFEIEDQQAKKYLSLGIGKNLEMKSAETPSKGIGSGSARPIPQPGGFGGAPEASPAKIAVAPMIRALAKEKGISLQELETLSGSGSGGHLTKEDFLKYLDKRGSTGRFSETAVEVPLTPIRARIAEKMTLSKRSIPHAGTGIDVDVTTIETWREKNRGRVGLLAFVLFSAIPSLRKFPVLNSSFKEKEGRQWIEQYPHVHLGVATATAQGLMVPVLREADRLSFLELVSRGTELIEKARSGRLGVDELTGGTFTVNNTGALGATRSSQIIPYPQAGILAINRVTKRPWVVNDEVRIRSILPLDLAFDHRLVDGDQACGFLEDLRQRLENFDFSAIR